MSSTPFGEHLKREREMRGVSLEEIAAATRINTRYLEALEKAHWSDLPGGAFNRGFIRSVARFLGLDEEGLIAEYASEIKEKNDAAHPPAEIPRDWKPFLAALFLIVVLGLLVLGGVFGYKFYRARRAAHQQQAAGVSSGTPVLGTPASGAPASIIPPASTPPATAPADVPSQQPGPTAPEALPRRPLTEEAISAELREQVRSGSAAPAQKLAICDGSTVLGAEDRVELLAVLAADADSAISSRAQSALLSQPAEHFVSAASRADADPRLFTFCARRMGDKAGVADALATNPACPTADVAGAAAHLTPPGIQALLDNLERFTSDEKLLAAVCASPAANAEQRELLAEIQKGAPEMTSIAEAALELEPDPVKRETLMQRVAQMNVVQRLTLALKGGRTERSLLIRDSNKLVQKCVLQSPRLTTTEVEGFACMTNLPAEILRTIGLTRVFMKNYAVVRNLINNPKTPLDMSLHLLPRINATDLMKLTNNKNVPETLRSTAIKLHRKRKMGLPG